MSKTKHKKNEKKSNHSETQNATPAEQAAPSVNFVVDILSDAVAHGLGDHPIARKAIKAPFSVPLFIWNWAIEEKKARLEGKSNPGCYAFILVASEMSLSSGLSAVSMPTALLVSMQSIVDSFSSEKNQKTNKPISEEGLKEFIQYCEENNYPVIHEEDDSFSDYHPHLDDGSLNDCHDLPRGIGNTIRFTSEALAEIFAGGTHADSSSGFKEPLRQRTKTPIESVEKESSPTLISQKIPVPEKDGITDFNQFRPKSQNHHGNSYPWLAIAEANRLQEMTQSLKHQNHGDILSATSTYTPPESDKPKIFTGLQGIELRHSFGAFGLQEHLSLLSEPEPEQQGVSKREDKEPLPPIENKAHSAGSMEQSSESLPKRKPYNPPHADERKTNNNGWGEFGFKLEFGPDLIKVGFINTNNAIGMDVEVGFVYKGLDTAIENAVNRFLGGDYISEGKMEILGKKYTYEITSVGGFGGLDFSNIKKLKITLRPKDHGKSSHSRVRLEEYDIESEANAPAFEEAFATVIQRAIEKRFPNLKEDKNTFQKKYARAMRNGNFDKARRLVDEFSAKYTVIPDIQDAVEKFHRKINLGITDNLVEEKVALFEGGNHEEIITQLTSIMSSNPRYQKRYQETLDDLNQHYEKIKEKKLANQKYQEYLDKIAEVNSHIKEKNLTDAISILKELVKNHPEHNNDLQRLESLQKSIDDQNLVLAFIKQHLDADNLYDAIDDMITLVKLNPDYQADLDRLIAIRAGQLMVLFKANLEGNNFFGALGISKELTSLDEKYRPLFQFMEKIIFADSILDSFKEKIETTTESYNNGHITEDEYLRQIQDFSEYEILYNQAAEKIEQTEFCSDELKSHLNDNRDFIIDRQDIALRNIISTQLSKIKATFETMSSSNADTVTAEILALFETISTRWSSINQKNNHTYLIFSKAEWAYKIKRYDIIIDCYKEILLVNPKNYYAFVGLLDIQIKTKKDDVGIYEFIQQYESHFTDAHEKTIIGLYKARVQNDIHELKKLFEEVKAFKDPQERFYHMKLCMHFLNTLNTEHKVAAYIAHPDVIRLSMTEQSIELLKEYIERCNELKIQIADEKKQLEELEEKRLELSESELAEADEKINHLKNRLAELEKDKTNLFINSKHNIEKEENQKILRKICKASYLHLGIDVTMRLFERTSLYEKLCIKKIGISKRMLNDSRVVVDHGVSLYKEIQYQEYQDGFKKLKEKMGENFSEELDKMEESVNTSNSSTNQYSSALSKFFKIHKADILKFKLGVAIIDLGFQYFYEQYASNEIKQNNVPLSYEEWYNEKILKFNKEEHQNYDIKGLTQIGKIGLGYCISYSKSTLDWLSRIEIINQLYGIFNSKEINLESIYHTYSTMMSFPYLAKHLLDLSLLLNGGKKATNLFPVLLTSLLENMSEDAFQQILMADGETLIQGFVDISYRFPFYNIATKIVDNLPRIRQALYFTRQAYLFQKVIFNYHNQILDRRVYNLRQDINALFIELSNKTLDHQSKLKVSRKAARLFCDFKYLSLGLTEHSEKNQLYITTMYYQHYFENSFKIYECDEVDNALFEAISHYTDESASQLKAIVTDGMKSNEERIEQPGVALDKSIISKLSMRLQRPIIVISQDHRGEIFLCFGKESFNDPNNIRDGHPIFVLYNSSHRYHGLQVRGEEYFESHLSKKLDNSVSFSNNELHEEYSKAKEAMKKLGLLSSAPRKKSKEKTLDLLSQGFFGRRLTTQESSKSTKERNNHASQPSKKKLATASEFNFG